MEGNEYKAVFSKLHTSVDESAIILKKPRSRRPRSAAVLAAALVIIALAASAAAIYKSRLQDLVLPSREESSEEVSEPGVTQSVSYDPLEAGTDMISLQGYAGSPEYKAALEWAEFEHGYDRDGKILEGTGNSPTEWDEEYGFNGYLVYSQEMADKIDEIAAKCGLEKHTGGIFPADIAGLKERFGAFAAADRWGGYYYNDGTFQCDCETDSVSFQLRRSVKGIMDTVLLNINDVEAYEQWDYKTACGETVLLALGPEKSLIFADLEGSFVAVNVLCGTVASFTARELEELADSIDFSVL